MEPATSAIRTEGLVKVYGQRSVVNGVNVHVQAGEIVGLLGPNGAGKTTTPRISACTAVRASASVTCRRKPPFSAS